MLNIEKLDNQSYSNAIVSMYEELNTELINDVLERVENTSEINTVTQSQLKRIAERGGKELFTEALKKADSLSALRRQELLALFTEFIKDDISDYKTLYDERNLPFELTEEQLKLFNNMVTLTDGELQNFTNSIAFATQQTYIDAVDNMYKQVVTGGLDFQTAFRKTTNALASQGIKLTTSNGATRSIEAAVRQNVLYGLRRTSQLINDELIDYLEADAVQVNISQNCRPSHQIINGKVFSLKQNNSKYPYLKKEYQALFDEYNCQHYRSPFIIGVSEPIYSDKEINEANNRTVTYKGEEIPFYEATQRQRALERAVRNAKKTYMNDQSVENKAKISIAQGNIREFIKETGLTRYYNREYYAGYNN